MSTYLVIRVSLFLIHSNNFGRWPTNSRAAVQICASGLFQLAFPRHKVNSLTVQAVESRSLPGACCNSLLSRAATLTPAHSFRRFLPEVAQQKHALLRAKHRYSSRTIQRYHLGLDGSPIMSIRRNRCWNEIELRACEFEAFQSKVQSFQ